MTDKSSLPVQLGTLCSKIGSGVTPRGGDSVYISEGVSLIRSQNVYNLEFTSDGLAYIDEKQAEKMDGVTVLENDVLLNITGDSVARCCIVPSSVLPARVNQHVSIIRTDSTKLNPHYLMYYLTSPYAQAYLLSLAGSGGTRKALTKSMIEALKIPLPSLSAQENIVSVLSAYDDLIENNRRRIDLLEQSARMLYKEWFVSLRFPGHEHVKVKDGVPQGWEKAVFADIGEDIRDSVRPEQVDPQTPYIGLEHMPRRSITLTDWGSAEDVTSNKFRFLEGDILFGKIRPYFHKVGFALTDGITSSDAIVMRPTYEKFFAYLLMTASSDHFVKMVSQTVKEGSKMPRANWDVMQQYPVFIPPDNILYSFSEVIKNIVKQLKALALQNQKLQQARDLLLPRLMNGEIPV